MQAIYIAICGAAVLLVAGCMPVPIPGKVDMSPEVYGRVIDAEDGQPIAGATVAFKALHETRRSQASTQTNGTFRLGPEWHSYRVVVFTACPVRYIPKRPPYAWFLEIAHTDYATREIQMWDYPKSNTVSGVTAVRLGEVTLDPVRPRSNKNRANNR